MQLAVFTKGVVLSGVICLATACGFKSDLFIPGDPKNSGQLDNSSLEILRQRTLESLQQQDSEDQDARLRETTDEPAVVPSVNEGVPVTVEPLTDEELKEVENNRDKIKQQ